MENTAYRFDLFEEQPKRVRKTEKQPELKLVKKKKPIVEKRKVLFLNVSQETVQIMKIFMASALCLFALSAMLFQNATIDELNREKSKIIDQIAIEKSINTKLQSDIDKEISLNTIEEYVVGELGMTKIQKYQIHYVDLSGEDEVILCSD